MAVLSGMRRIPRSIGMPVAIEPDDVFIYIRKVGFFMKNFVISPDVINILGAAPEANTLISVNQPQPQQQPEPAKPSFWQRVGGFFKNAYEVIKPVLSIINTFVGVLNALSRFKYATRSRAGCAW